jgi:hypothetical protein
MKSFGKLLVPFFALSFCCVLGSAQTPSTSGATGVPQLVNFSGKASDVQGKPISGVAGATFAIYQQQYEGAPLWMETQNVTADSKGNYTAQLGATKPEGLPLDLFASGEARWLGVTINGGQEQPRVLLLSVPYALKAADAQTLGGLPPSAFVLAAPANASNVSATGLVPAASSASAPPPASADVTTTGGRVNAIPLFSTATNIQNSILTQTGTTAVNVVGKLNLPTTGVATATAGKNSRPESFVTSVFNSGTATAVPQTFLLQAEPAGNDTATASGTLNLLYASGTATPAETGLKISSTGLITFATGQPFPGTGNGTITGVTAGTALTGGGTTGAVALNLDTTKVPLLAAANTFTGNQTVNGNLSATGVVTGSGYQIGSNLFAFGSYKNQNAFLGFAGNMATNTTSSSNTAVGARASLYNTTGSLNSAFGAAALQDNTTGGGNSAFGATALLSNTTGSSNTALGASVLYFNTTGGANTGAGVGALFVNTTGFNNTAVGSSALYQNGSGSDNTATGVDALADNTTGVGNDAFGYQALDSNTSGIGNDAFGYQALSNTNTGGNDAFGYQALFSNTAGLNDDAFGYQALYSNTGSSNNAFGYQALLSSTTGSFSDAFGYQALYSSTTGSNDAFGYQALGATTTGGANNAFGYRALTANNVGGQNSAFGTGALLSNTSGNGNNAFGYLALESNTAASGNSAFGYQALVSSTSGGLDAFGYQALYSDFDGNPNGAFGYQALYSNTSGDGNDAFGYRALYTNTVGSDSIAFGFDALYSNTTGFYNVGLGAAALSQNTTGGGNTGVGFDALSGNTTGNSNTCIGVSCSTSSDGLENATAIGAHAKVGQSNSLVLGGTGEYAVKVGIGTTTPSNILTVAQGAGHPVSDSWETYSSRRWKTNIQTLPNALAKVQQLRGVSYDLKDSGKHEIGVIAEEVGAVVPELVTFEANGKDARSVDYARLTALLIEATKDQQRELQRQQSLLKTQAAAIRDLKSELRATRQSLQNIKAQTISAQPALVARESSAKIQVR